MTDMKPCPFCGRTGFFQWYFDFERGYTDYPDAITEKVVIECDCGCSLRVNTEDYFDIECMKEHVIKTWNKRWKE